MVPVPSISLLPDPELLTPFADVSLATSVKLPLAVVILLLILMCRPACIVKLPPEDPVAVMAEETVMSRLACSVTLVPDVIAEAIVEAFM